LITYPWLGAQKLTSKYIEAGAFVDYSSEKEFGGMATVFIVEKDSVLAPESDYTIANGVITFHNIGIYTVTMTNAAIISWQDFPAKVMVEIHVHPLGINENTQQQDINLYPNPVSNILYIETENRVPEVKIYSNQGVLLLQTKGHQIDLSSLPSGIYIADIDGVCRNVVKR
jgi:hypothetical protein